MNENTVAQEVTMRVGISQCLLGEMVRYDGGHKRDLYLTDVLGNYFEWVPVCPELEVGMGVPREAVRLVLSNDEVKMVGNKSGEDWTKRVNSFSESRVKQLEELELCGFIFKSKSPTCGMERVTLYTEKGMPAKNGVGLFADVFMKTFPQIPAEEEGRLNDAQIRENFIVRVFSYHRLKQLLNNFSRGALVQFHTIHKYLMLSHSERHYRELGVIVANSKSIKPSELKERYSALFMEGLSVKATTKKHVNVLLHILGYFRDHLSAKERAEILSVIEDYHKEYVPLVVPIMLINHYIKLNNVEYLCDQVYLHPHPKELMLRNRV